MSFNLCNVLKTFQIFINKTFQKYFDDFCTTYLNDILVYNNSKAEHIEHVNKILLKLEKTDLYLNIDKCEFHVIKIKYLNLIIIIESIQMNFDKIKVILKWKISRTIKDVQTFFDFVNFYRRFIHKYFNLAQFLTTLTKKDNKEKLFSWTSNESKDKIFQQLKQAFAFISILRHFDFNLETWLKIDVFDFVVIVILSQKKLDELFYFVIYMSKIMSSAECNYEIYDKKLLIIVRIFKEWHPKCAEILVKEFIRVINDHRNLKHFMTTKQLNRRQTRWTKFLSKFNFKIKYRSNVQETKPDNLIQRSQNVSSSFDDFRNQFQRQTIFKVHHLSKKLYIFKKSKLQIGIVKVAVLISLLQAHNTNRMTELINLIYALIEKEFLPQKIVSNDIDENSFEKNDVSLSSKKLMTKIRETYLKDEKLQRIINVK